MDLDLTQVLILTEILTSPSDLAILSLLTLSAFPFKHFIHPMSAWTSDPALVDPDQDPKRLYKKCTSRPQPTSPLDSLVTLAF
jgi:hypothetical protein